MASPRGAEEPPQAGAGKPEKKEGVVDKLRIVGGLAALVAGLCALLAVLVIALAAKVSGDQITQLATTAIGVIGSIVGAYFGVKIGSDGTQKALENQREEAARSQVFAAHLPPEVATKALDLAFPQGVPGGDPPGDPAKPAAPPARPGGG